LVDALFGRTSQNNLFGRVETRQMVRQNDKSMGGGTSFGYRVD
jgi:hypothetical protein